MVLSIIFLEDQHKSLLHLSIFYEYQQFFQHRICFSIQPPDYSDPWPTLAHSSSFFLIMLFNKLRVSLDISCWSSNGYDSSLRPNYHICYSLGPFKLGIVVIVHSLLLNHIFIIKFGFFPCFIIVSISFKNTTASVV